MVELSSVNLNRLITFVAVVEAGSLTAAAERLGLAKSMVSKHMQLLEAEVGVGLLLRSTRKLALTEAGRAFYDASRQLLQQAEQAIEQARSSRDIPQGTLRVASPIDYGVMVVAPLLSQLRARYPALKVELVCGDGLIDLIAEGIDVTVRLGKLADSGYMAARVGRLRRWLVASPAFVASHGMPDGPEALPALPYIALTVLQQPQSFTLEHADGRQHAVRMLNTVFATNTATVCRAAALAGDGVLRATEFSVREDLAAGRLVRLLPAWTLPESDIHAVFPASPHLPQKVRVFIDALKLAAGD
ncbi:LysR family transcriptional regulator [Rugamonas rivuli]|uniref:LysR family transcriptional regulator n=1 Tax=Rugamonas rivuli TaxID=2743358 RepID=A0A843SBM2_9BURK|nr:LysR family transcriptional regulator [Rugamonas rivuli]MQA19590.1 LysR family transcriptional regulator [Rugamonas rivuli]